MISTYFSHGWILAPEDEEGALPTVLGSPPPPPLYCFSGWCSATQSGLHLGDPKDCSPPGVPVLQHFLELAQTHVHWVSAFLSFWQVQFFKVSPTHTGNCILTAHFKSLPWFAHRWILLPTYPTKWNTAFLSRTSHPLLTLTGRPIPNSIFKNSQHGPDAWNSLR